jgi:uncharacterized membrane protein YoaK (UPF0700 family)
VNAAPAAPRARVLTVVAVLLTFASGASDVASFTRLGNVFTSVMTGNITLFGLSLARGSVSLAAHTAVAFAGYVTGVFAGTRIISHHADRRPAGPAAKEPDSEWPSRTTPALLAELAMLTGVLIGWELTGAQPAGAAQYVILALAACAMGIQSATVNHMGLSNVSTTFLTGTLTGLVSAIARRGATAGRRRPAVLGGLVVGALLAGVLDATAAAGVPLLPLLAVAAALAFGTGLPRPGWPRPGRLHLGRPHLGRLHPRSTFRPRPKARADNEP